MQVRSKNVLGIFIHIFLVTFLAEDGRAEGRAAASRAADANAREQLKGRDDGHREAPTADGLATHPRAEKASQSGIHERDDAADAGQAFDACETRTSNAPCRPSCLCTCCIALLGLPCSGGAPGCGRPCTATCDDPVEDDDATQDAANCWVSRVRRAAAHYGHANGKRDRGQWCLRNFGQGASNAFGGASEAVSYLAWCRRSSIGGLAGHGHFWSPEAAERCGRQTDEDETASDKKDRHVQQISCQNNRSSWILTEKREGLGLK